MIKLPDNNNNNNSNYYDKSSNIGIDAQAQWEQARRQAQLDELSPCHSRTRATNNP